MSSASRLSGTTVIRYAQNQKIGKPNNLKLFGSKKPKWHKEDSQYNCHCELLYYTKKGGPGWFNQLGSLIT